MTDPIKATELVAWQCSGCGAGVATDRSWVRLPHIANKHGAWAGHSCTLDQYV